MRTPRFPLLVVAGCMVPLIAHIALAQGDPTAPPPPAPPADSAVPAAPTTTDTTAPAPSGSTTQPSPTDTAPVAPPPTDTAPVAPPPTDTAPVAPPPTETAPVAPPAVTAAPVEPQPTAAPPMVAPPPVEADKGQRKKPYRSTLAIEGNAGATVRVGSISSGYESASRSGLAYGAGVFYAPDRMWAFGLTYEYALAGREDFSPSANDSIGNIERHLQTAALNLRAYPLRSDSIGMYAGLMIGATWQTASASGSYMVDTFHATPTQTYQSDGGPNAGLAFGASLGMDVDLNQDVAMLTSVNFAHHRLSSDLMNGSDEPKVPGIGNTSQIDFRLAFQYRFDLAGSSSVRGNASTGSR